VAVGVVGVSVALAGLGLAALPGATLGVLGGAAVSNSFARRPKPPLRPEDVQRDEEGRLENWGQLLRAVQQGVREAPAGRQARMLGGTVGALPLLTVVCWC